MRELVLKQRRKCGLRQFERRLELSREFPAVELLVRAVNGESLLDKLMLALGGSPSVGCKIFANARAVRFHNRRIELEFELHDLEWKLVRWYAEKGCVSSKRAAEILEELKLPGVCGVADSIRRGTLREVGELVLTEEYFGLD